MYMKKLYFLSLCALLSCGVCDASSRFKAHSRPESVFKELAAESKVMRPESSQEYIYDFGEWALISSTQYAYDRQGNAIEQTADEDGELFKVLSKFSEYNRPTEILGQIDEGSGWENSTLRTYEYDAVLHDYCIKRMGYDWEDGWVENAFCEQNIIARDEAGNITGITKLLPMGNLFIPAYKSEWKYTSGAATEFAYYANYGGMGMPSWQLYDGTSYKNIRWASCNGQMTGSSFYEFVSGPNKVEYADVYYNDEIDGHFLVTYTETGYSLRETFSDIEKVGKKVDYTTTDDNGGFKKTTYEYFDSEGNYSSEPTYIMEQTVVVDEHGNPTEETIYETMDGLRELVQGYRAEYSYDSDGNVEESTSYYYDYDSKQYVPDSKMVYGAYHDVSTGVEEISASTVAWNRTAEMISVSGSGVCGLRIYDMQGRSLLHSAGNPASLSLSGLPSGVYIARADGTGAILRFAK